jgi:hypothetical protein
MTGTRHHLGWAVLLSAGCATGASRPQTPTPGHSDPLNIVLGSMHHGPGEESPAAVLAFESLRREPRTTVARVDERYPIGELALLTRRDLEFERAVLLLEVLKDGGADELLARWFVELRRIRIADGGSHRPPYDRVVLQHLRSFDANAVSVLLADLENMSLTDRTGALAYLAVAAPGHPEVQEALETIYQRPSSSLYLDGPLGRLLHFLRTGEVRR